MVYVRYTYSCVRLSCHTHTLSPGSNINGSVMVAVSWIDQATLVIFPFFTRAMCICFPWIVLTRVENIYNPLIVAVNFPDLPSYPPPTFFSTWSNTITSRYPRLRGELLFAWNMTFRLEYPGKKTLRVQIS